MRAADLREKGADDLKELQRSLARDVFQNRLKNFTNRLDDTSAIRKTRRDLARVTTLLREAELGIVRAARAAGAPAPEPAEAKESGTTKAEGEAKPKKSAPKKAAGAAKPAKKSAKKDEAKKS
jgi:large subunit ribosomal protein L29